MLLDCFVTGGVVLCVDHIIHVVVVRLSKKSRKISISHEFRIHVNCKNNPRRTSHAYDL